MGSGHSHNQNRGAEEIPLKETPQQQQQQPKKQQPQHVMITKEVSERWASIARQNWEERERDNEKVKMMMSESSAVEDSDEGEGQPSGPPTPRETEDEGTLGDGDGGKEKTEPDVEDKDKEVKGEVETGASGEPAPSGEAEPEGRGGDEEETVSGAEEPESESKGAAGPRGDIGIDEDKPEAGPDDKLPESESMDKLASIMAGSTKDPSNGLEDDFDLESGSNPTDDEDINLLNSDQDLQRFQSSPSSSLSAFQKPAMSNITSNSKPEEFYQLPEYEEVNEMFKVGGKRSPILEDIDLGGDEDDDDQAPLLGKLQIEEPKTRSRELHIAKAILPVVIDNGINGEPTVSTIGAWRVKERLEEELVKNDEHWSGEMRSLTRRFEDSTMKHAEDVDQRIRELETKYPDIVGMGAASSASGGTGPQEGPRCSGLASQIGKCYEKNKNERLKCHGLIRQFAQCTKKSIEEKFLNKV